MRTLSCGALAILSSTVYPVFCSLLYVLYFVLYSMSCILSSNICPVFYRYRMSCIFTSTVITYFVLYRMSCILYSIVYPVFYPLLYVLYFVLHCKSCILSSTVYPVFYFVVQDTSLYSNDFVISYQECKKLLCSMC